MAIGSVPFGATWVARHGGISVFALGAALLVLSEAVVAGVAADQVTALPEPLVPVGPNDLAGCIVLCWKQ